MAARLTTGAADLVGHILCRIRYDGQVVPQLVHIVQSVGTDSGDRFHPVTVFDDQSLQAIGMFRKTVRRGAAKVIEVPRLAREEFPREAQFPVDDGQSSFKLCRLGRQGISDL